MVRKEDLDLIYTLDKVSDVCSICGFMLQLLPLLNIRNVKSKSGCNTKKRKKEVVEKLGLLTRCIQAPAPITKTGFLVSMTFKKSGYRREKKIKK